MQALIAKMAGCRGFDAIGRFKGDGRRRDAGRLTSAIDQSGGALAAVHGSGLSTDQAGRL